MLLAGLESAVWLGSRELEMCMFRVGELPAQFCPGLGSPRDQ